jgi:hypothetical protein
MGAESDLYVCMYSLKPYTQWASIGEVKDVGSPTGCDSAATIK